MTVSTDLVSVSSMAISNHSNLRPQLVVDLEALAANFRTFVASVAPAQVGAVVKANAYGLGVKAVSLRLFDEGCREFFVVTLQEAVELRKILREYDAAKAIEPTIYLLDGFDPDDHVEFKAWNIRPVLYSIESLLWWDSLLKPNEKLPEYALKLDSGMTRFGLLESELEGVLKQLTPDFPAPSLILSHLACADDESSIANDQQLKAFQRMSAQLIKYFGPVSLSISNSAGTDLGTEFHNDLVRVGAGLFGLDTRPHQQHSLKPVVTLKVPVRQIKRLDRSATVGYGAQASVSEGQRLAVAAGGYADGIHRIIGSEGFAVVDGVRCPQIGRISMDSAVYDLSVLPQDVEPEWLEIISVQYPLHFWCQYSHLLGYELLTAIGHRVERQYV